MIEIYFHTFGYVAIIWICAIVISVLVVVLMFNTFNTKEFYMSILAVTCSGYVVLKTTPDFYEDADIISHYPAKILQTESGVLVVDTVSGKSINITDHSQVMKFQKGATIISRNHNASLFTFKIHSGHVVRAYANDQKD